MAASHSTVLGFTDIADELGSEAQIKQLRDDAFALINAGKGEVGFITSATFNGKIAMQIKDMSAQDVFDNASEALRIIRGMAVSCTYSDFSCLGGC